MNPAARGRRPHPVGLLRGEPTRRCASPDTPGTEQVRRSVPGLTLVRGVPFDKMFLIRHRGRRFKRVDTLADSFKAVYRRRDMLGALLYHALSTAGVEQIKVDDKVIESIALLRDEDTGSFRVSVRSRRGRKGA